YSNGGVMNEAGNVFGTYIHGIFDNMEFTSGLINNLRNKKGLEKLEHDKNMSFGVYKEQQYDKLADMIRANLDMEKIYEIVGISV
ncbi:MAG: cobyric acid synthase CobQ, partial [Bacillota bacterium]|nr:cobyric acid synthase CobQ [Bacillota bacterium]